MHTPREISKLYAHTKRNIKAICTYQEKYQGYMHTPSEISNLYAHTKRISKLYCRQQDKEQINKAHTPDKKNQSDPLK